MCGTGEVWGSVPGHPQDLCCRAPEVLPLPFAAAVRKIRLYLKVLVWFFFLFFFFLYFRLGMCLGHATKGRNSSEAMLGFSFKDGAVLLKELDLLASLVSS